MFKALFTPLKARFDFDRSPPVPPVSPSAASVTSFGNRVLLDTPEDFTRDEYIQSMRQSVEDVREAGDMGERLKLLAEIHRLMVAEPATKDVFKELDGFIVIMSLLSALQPGDNGAYDKPDLIERMEVVRLALATTSQATASHPHNKEYFERCVGYDALTRAIAPFAQDPRTLDQTLGFLLSLALSDFSLSGIFPSLRDATARDTGLSQLEHRLGEIRVPQAILVIVNLLDGIPKTDEVLPFCVFKIVEKLASYCHRNQASLNTTGLGRILFERLYLPMNSHFISPQTELVMQKLLKRMLGIGAPTKDVRLMFTKLVQQNGTLDNSVLELLRMSMKVRWPPHFSLNGVAAIDLKEDAGKGMPCPQGFSFMAWIFVEAFAKGACMLFSVRTSQRRFIKLSLRIDGKLELWTNAVRDPVVLEGSLIQKGRWTHLAFVHYPSKSSTPTIRTFIDGALTDSLTWSYPKIDSQPTTYSLGDLNPAMGLKWNLASACLLSIPLSDDIPRLVHHLGPRYNAQLQDPNLTRFLTYSAAASLNIYLFSVASARTKKETALIKAIKSGIGITEEQFVFALSPAGVESTTDDNRQIVAVRNAIKGKNELAVIRNDVITYTPQCLDIGVWEIGGSAVLLRIVELAENPHHLCNAIGILADALRTSWQNSEDMERIRGYEILASILRGKSQLINMATFEVLFEFLGLDFHTPESSTIVNTVAYRFIALDFEIWSHSRKEVQRAHLEHFVTLLQTSRYKRFNLKQRIAKFSLVRKLLFILQTDMYQLDVLPYLVDALRVAASQHFSVDDSIKPIVAYLAANLHEAEVVSGTSHRSVISRVDRVHAHEKAEQVLECFVAILSSPGKLEKFARVLPLPRICLLLLGEHPTSVVASQILLLIGLTLKQSASFSRKFELVSGWAVFRGTLPDAWDPSVHVAAFDVLLGRIDSDIHQSRQASNSLKISCPYILPGILASLDRGLTRLAKGRTVAMNGDVGHSSAIDSAMEVLLEELIDLHSSSLSFRELFKSHQTTTLLIEACRSFVTSVANDVDARQRTVRILDKVTHLVLMLALDNNVDGSHKQELLGIIRLVEESNSGPTHNSIDSSLLSVNQRPTHGRRRSGTTRRSLQILGDRTYQKSLSRIQEWRKTIILTEKKRLRKLFQDLQEHHRQAERLIQWRTSVVMEPGLWSTWTERKWRLDETEGPYRIRKKLEPQEIKVFSVKDNEEISRTVEEPDFDAQSIVQLEVPPWAESYEFSITDVEDQEWAEDVREDKHRRVRHELEPGDVIEAVATAARIIGVDSSPGLLILGKTHLYMLDGLVEGRDEEVIEAKDAPKNLFFVPGTMVELDGIQRAQRWPYAQIVTCSKRTCLFRDVALEIYFRDTRNLLVVFASKQDRQTIHSKLISIQSTLVGGVDALSPAILRTPLISKVSARILTSFRDELSTAQRRWQAREISNFTYLSIINQTSGRTPSDATQYPIYPWVLQDYSSETLDLTSTKTFRDLRKPMGALNAAREEAAMARYTSLQAIQETPFHYGTHFSSSMITCHFLIRLEPFAHMFKRLQGGDWDLPDRLFTDIQRAYKSASEDSRGDVRELIPEFYTCPEFLVNSSDIDFGVQNSGEKIHDVKLPPWAKQDPLLFITQHRRALESDYVSENLPYWIDLIWGYKQRDPKSFNVYHPLSYEGSVDLDSIADEVEREATVGIIHNFGQTPRKLFTGPHPPRLMHGISTLPLGTLHGIEEDYSLLAQSAKHVRDLGVPISSISLDVFSERVLPCRDNMMYIPSYPHEYVAWGFLDQSLRLYSDRKLVQCYEASFCSCCTFPDAETLVTGSHDSEVRLWRLAHQDQSSFSLLYVLRGHRGRVLCVAASRAWSLVVSGSEDGLAILWELNRAEYVRAIEHASPVQLAVINESTGYIATCSREKLCLHTVNAHHIVTLYLAGSHPAQRITSLAFHEREWSYLGVLATGTVGGTIILRTWNTDGSPAGEKADWRFQTLRTLKCRPEEGGKIPNVTALKFVGETLFVGQGDGKVFLWDVPE